MVVCSTSVPRPRMTLRVFSLPSGKYTVGNGDRVGWARPILTLQGRNLHTLKTDYELAQLDKQL